MRVLVTGAAGFVGRYLVEELARTGHSPLAADFEFASPVQAATEVFTFDLQDKVALERVLSENTPDACIHLAAISSVPEGLSKPDRMLSINIGGTLGLLEAVRCHAPSCQTLIVSTAQVYAASADNAAIAEDTPLAPVSLYAVTKAACDMAALGYARRFNLPVMTARPNNHTGPGQVPKFVIPAFINQIRDIAKGDADPVLNVGNLDSERTFSDVRDIVRAYRLLIETGTPGNAYNISAGQSLRIGDILDTLCGLTGVNPEKKIDPEKYRPTDYSPLLDISKLQSTTGWEPKIDFEQTLKDMLSE